MSAIEALARNIRAMNSIQKKSEHDGTWRKGAITFVNQFTNEVEVRWLGEKEEEMLPLEHVIESVDNNTIKIGSKIDQEMYKILYKDK